MSVPPASDPNFAPPPPPPRQPGAEKPWLKWVAIGCVALILIFGIIIAGIWFTVSKATEGPETVVREFLAAAAAEDFETAHGYFSAPLQEVQSQAQLEEMVRANPSLFAISDVSFNNRSVDMNGAELSGNVTLETGTVMPAQFRLVKENDDWKLIAWNIGSS